MGLPAGYGERVVLIKPVAQRTVYPARRERYEGEL